MVTAGSLIASLFTMLICELRLPIATRRRLRLLRNSDAIVQTGFSCSIVWLWCHITYIRRYLRYLIWYTGSLFIFPNHHVLYSILPRVVVVDQATNRVPNLEDPRLQTLTNSFIVAPIVGNYRLIIPLACRKYPKIAEIPLQSNFSPIYSH